MFNIPGSSKCVKFLPFHPKTNQKAEILHIRRIQVYIYIYTDTLPKTNSKFATENRPDRLNPEISPLEKPLDFSRGEIGWLSVSSGRVAVCFKNEFSNPQSHRIHGTGIFTYMNA